MAQYSIFIAHTSEDITLANSICTALNRIWEFNPYLATNFPSYGENFKERIQNVIERSNFMIVLLTESGIKNQWVNQEVGYACAIKKKNKRLKIIPISISGINLKGFITRDSEDILFLDKYSLKFLIANIVNGIRNNIPNGYREGSLNIKLICKVCKDKSGLPFQWKGSVPSSDAIIRTIESDNPLWTYNCPKCGEKVVVDITDFEQI